MRVEIWSDIVCPWCYIGKRRFEAALDGFEHRDSVEVVWRSFELDPSAPRRLTGPLDEALAAKYGMPLEQAREMQRMMTETAAAEGLDFRFDRARSGNTFDGHRLLHLAADRNLQGALKERLMRAYYTEGKAVTEHDVLLELATEVGLDADEVRVVLAGDAYADAVRAEERAAEDIGIRGVPFFVIDRKYAVSGAQPADLILSTLRNAWAEAHPMVVMGGDGASCADGSCAVPTAGEHRSAR